MSADKDLSHRDLSRRDFLRISVAGAAAAGALCAGCSRGGHRPGEAAHQPSPAGHGPRVVISGVDHYRVMDPLFEGVRVMLSHHGEKFTPAYIQGISGAAFRVAGICPCAPTCSAQMGTTDLIKLLGYSCSKFNLGLKIEEVRPRMQKLLPKIKDSIREGRPVLVWHAFTSAEWDVVAGFDETTHELLGRGSYAGLDELAKAKDTRPQEALEICPALGAIFIGEKTGKFDASAAELASLKEAVRHAKDTKGTDAQAGKWAMLQGLAAYDRWWQQFKKADAKKSNGDSYCVNIYRSTHRAGAAFLQEIAPRHAAAAERLLAASKSLASEADALDRAEPLIGWKSPTVDIERNAKVWPILAEARGHYAKAIDEIQKAVTLIG